MSEMPRVVKEGTLRLTPEQRIGTWETWTEAVRDKIANNDIEGAAHTLACCMVSPDTDSDELSKARPMFTLPELAGRHQQLWDLIVKDNELVYDDGITQRIQPWGDKERIANFLFDEFGWKIE